MAVTRVHIDRLVLDGIEGADVGSRRGFADAVRAAIEQQLRDAPLSVSRGAAINRVRAGPVRMDGAARLGASVGRTVSESIRGATIGDRRA